jgi:hypothetical protein
MYGDVVGLAAEVVLTVFVVVAGIVPSAVAGQHRAPHWSKHSTLSHALHV